MAPKGEPKRRVKLSNPRGDTGKISNNIEPIRGNLNEHLFRLYGEELLKSTKTYSKLLIQKSQLLCDLTFLKSCRNNQIIPKSLQLKHHNRTSSNSKTLNKACHALVRESIQTTRRKLNTTNSKLYTTYSDIHSHNIHPILWNAVDRLSYEKADYIASQKTNTQKQKLAQLILNQNPKQKPKPIHISNTVHNFSDSPITTTATQALSKGFNFAITPKVIPTEHIISQIESTISHLNPEDAELIRQDTSRILRNSKPPPSNLSYQERQALKDLRNNENLIILPADKGNATVILNTTDYNQKMTELLSSDEYKPIKNDPTTYLEKTTKQIISSSTLNDDIKKLTIPREKSSRIPKAYGLPKIHKKDIPLRPIISAFSSPTHKLAQYLAKTLQPLAEQSNSYIKNSFHFLQKLKDFNITPNSLLVSFDVVSLFTNIPLSETFEILKNKHKTSPNTLSLIQHCTSNTYFSFQNCLFKQIKGAPMGSPLSPVLANIFMEDFETKAIETYPFKPTCWMRYVDDTFIIWPHGKDKLDSFLNHLNSQHQQIKFTMEIEKDQALPFLDVQIQKLPTQGFTHTIYRKPTHTNRYLNASSHHHPAQLNSVVHTLVSRSLKLTDNNNKNTEIQTLTNILHQNGYNKKQILRNISKVENPNTTTSPLDPDTQHKTFLPYIKGVTDKIGNILQKYDIKPIYTTNQKLVNLLRTPKDTIQNESPGVYEIPCADCPRSYIGQTNRRINNRVYEHKLALRKLEPSSALTKHHNETGHTFDFNKTKTIATIEHLKTRTIREAIEIEKHQNCLNKRDDALHLPSTWKPLLKNKNKNKTITEFTTMTSAHTAASHESSAQTTSTHVPFAHAPNIGIKCHAQTIGAHLSATSDSERIDNNQFFLNSDNRDVDRTTVSTLPLTSKCPLTSKDHLTSKHHITSKHHLTSKNPKPPEPPNPPSVLIGEIHSEDTTQNEPWTTRLRPRRPPNPSLENGSKRRAETSSKTLKPTRRYRKNL